MYSIETVGNDKFKVEKIFEAIDVFFLSSLVGKIKSMEKESNARLTRISDWLTGMSELMKVKPPKSTRKVVSIQIL